MTVYLKRAFSLTLAALILCGALAGCGSDSPTDNTTPGNNTPASTPMPAPTPEPTPESTPTPENTPELTPTPEPTPTPAPVNTHGNTSGNIANRGRAAIQGDWIYYSPPVSGKSGIFAINADGTEEQLVSSGGNNLNVVGDWIYYNTGGGICRIKTDGTDEQELYAEDSYGVQVVHVIGDWIYFSGYDNNYVGQVYRIKTDGADKQHIKELQPYDPYFTVDGDWIYYSVFDSATGGIYKTKTDGTETLRLCSDSPYTAVVDFDVPYSIIVSDGWVYFVVEGGLFKIKTDGTERQPINTSCYVYSFNVAGDWIYYSDLYFYEDYDYDNDCFNDYYRGDGLRKISTDGKTDQIVHERPGDWINVAGDWIYYTSIEPEIGYGVYYRIKTDGTERQLLGQGLW